MKKGTLPVSLLVGLVVAFVALRAPALRAGPDAGERAHAGASRHLVLRNDARPDAFRRDAPLATHLASLVLFAGVTPDAEWDDAGPDDQIGWIALHETRPAPDVPPLPAAEIALLTRLPAFLLNLLAFVLLLRMATRFYGSAAAAAGGLLICVSSGLAFEGVRASPVGLAPAAVILLLAAFDDHARALHIRGRPPTWLPRRRALQSGAAVGLCLATSVALVVPVGIALIWLLRRRAAARARDESVQPGAPWRFVLGLVSASAVVWLAHLLRIDAPFALTGDAESVAALGIPDAVSWPALPAGLWLRTLAAAVADALDAPLAASLHAVLVAGGPLLGLLALGALPAWLALRRDRIDVPSLLIAVGGAAALSAPLLAPRHAAVAAAAAVVPLAVLCGAWSVRAWRHRRAAWFVAAVAALIVGGVGWAGRVSAEAPLATQPDVVETAREPSPTEAWLLRRYVSGRAPPEVHTVLGREPLLRISGASRIHERAADDPALHDVVTRLDRGERVAIVLGEWALDGAPDDAAARVIVESRAPTDVLGRLLVYEHR